MTVKAVSLGEIIGEARTLAGQHQTILAATIVVIAAAYSALDWLEMSIKDRGGVVLLSSLIGLVVSLFAQYRITEHLIADRLKPGHRVRSYGSLFGALLLSGLAIGAGLIVLVLPGIYLAGRWLTVAPRVVVGDLASNDALRASWADSENSQFAFCLVTVLSFAPTVIMFGLGYLAATDLSPNANLALVVAQNLIVGVTSVLGWTFAAGAFRCVVANQSEFEQVFA